MADYYSVLKKTVAALPENNGASRRAIYQRARTAIVNQLKAYDPPLTPSEITNEQLRLEEAIRKVEAEAARETLGLNRPAAAQSPASPTGTGAVPAASVDNGPAAEKPASVARSAENGQAQASPMNGRSSAQAAGVASERQEPAMGAPSAASTSAFAPQASPLKASAPQTSAPQTSAPQFPPLRTPANAPVAQAPFASERAMAGDGNVTAAGPNGDGPMRGGKDRRSFDADRASYHGGPEEGLRPSRLPVILGALIVLLVLIGIGAIAYSQRDSFLALLNGSGESGPTTAATGEPGPAGGAPVASSKNADRLLTDAESPAAPDARTVTTTRISPTAPEGETVVAPQDAAPVPGGEAAPAETAPAQATPQTAPEDASDQSGATTGSEAQSGGSAAGEKLASTGTAAENSATTGTPAAPAPANPPAAGSSVASAPSIPGAGDAQTATVAQRSILYEEGADSNGTGTASAGQSVWSVEKNTEDGKEETVLKVLAEIADRGLGAEVSIKPNNDASLPASHLVEVKFDLPADFPNKGVKEVPGLVMKMTEEARGDALIGASVKVADGYFWLALSNVPSERDRNLALLRERGWIDIPILYEDGKRAILTLEKGTPGSKAVEQAIAAWK